MKKYMSIVFSIVLFTFLAGCSGVKVMNRESAPGTDFNKYKTFDFYKVKVSGDTVSKGFN